MVLNPPKQIILMGVAGSGKSTIGRALAARLGWRFIEGDDYHDPESVRKMASGTPLTDADRAGWLARLYSELRTGGPSVLACSALKERYRGVLRGDLEGVLFVFLRGDFDLFLGRLEQRTGHYMGAGMLRSQFEDLEIPTVAEALHVDASRSEEEIVEDILELVV